MGLHDLQKWQVLLKLQSDKAQNLPKQNKIWTFISNLDTGEFTMYLLLNINLHYVNLIDPISVVGYRVTWA